MSSRKFPIAAPIILFATLNGVAAAGETKPYVPESCTAVQSAGHPGKSVLLPKSRRGDAQQCSRPARKRLTLATYVDAAGGKALVAGRTDRALEQLYAKRAAPLAGPALTNLCVAHTVLRQWPEASDTCDAAVASATAARADGAYRPGSSLRQRNTAAAVAYSNRAVMHWLMRDTVAAQDDLASAQAILPGASFVARNARVAVPAPALAQGKAVPESIG
jgi:hypothetical protein